MPHNVLVVDDEKLIRWSVRERLQQDGIDVVEAEDAAQAQEAFDRSFDLVLLDITLPDGSGIDLIPKFRELDPDVPIVMMTGDATAETAVAAMQAGAYHYCTKPLNLNDLALLTARAIETTQLRRAARRLHTKSAQDYGFDHIVGNSSTMQVAKTLMGKIARSPASTVLVTGESGTGKDLAAKAIHYNSDRCKHAFVNITCSALPDALLESELFGHEKGSFTDARTQKKGLFEQADGGTVFLDEIGEMSPILQSKLLRVLEEKSFRRVGGNKDLTVDVRVIAATNRNLQEEVKQGAFREDLYYRLNVLSVELPPLRERVGDIPLLAEYFAQRFADEFRRPIKDTSKNALAALQAYGWPGNVREFRNAIERAVLLCEGKKLEANDFNLAASGAVLHDAIDLPAGGVNLDELERSLVTQALGRTNGNQTQAAKLLGLNRDQIRYRIEKYHLK